MTSSAAPSEPDTMRPLASLFDLRGRVAVVTGGGIGLGRHLAIALAEAGADLVIGGRRGDVLEATAAELRTLGRRALAVPTDVSHVHEVQRLAEHAVEALGAIAIWVNNAGINHVEPAETFSIERWRDVLAV